MHTGRFAPTCSGRAHPGTLVSALLAWLDARSQGGRFILRMEDIDPSSVRPAWRQALLDDLVWLGLDWDDLVWQSEREEDHRAFMDRLAATGRLYECTCSRSSVARAGLPAVSGAWRYPGTCRSRRLGPGSWRRASGGIRIDLGGMVIEARDESGLDLGQDLDAAMGDPLLRRPDGTWTYQLAVVADDEASGVDRIVRGRDIATSTATQIALRRLAGVSIPAYRHHFLFLEPRGDKLAKFHQSVSVETLRHRYEPATLVRALAGAAGLAVLDGEDGEGGDGTRGGGARVLLDRLVRDFSWSRVRTDDAVVHWDGVSLNFSSTPA